MFNNFGSVVVGTTGSSVAFDAYDAFGTQTIWATGDGGLNAVVRVGDYTDDTFTFNEFFTGNLRPLATTYNTELGVATTTYWGETFDNNLSQSGDGIWTRDLYTPTPVSSTRTGQAVPSIGFDTTIASVTPIGTTPSGSPISVFNLTGTGIDSSNNVAIGISGDNLLLQNGAEAPGLPGVTIAGILMPQFTATRQTTVVVQLAGTGVTAGVNDKALYALDETGGLSLLLRTNDVYSPGLFYNTYSGPTRVVDFGTTTAGVNPDAALFVAYVTPLTDPDGYPRFPVLIESPSPSGVGSSQIIAGPGGIPNDAPGQPTFLPPMNWQDSASGIGTDRTALFTPPVGGEPPFPNFSEHSVEINNFGQVAFWSSSSFFAGSGLWTGLPGELTQIAGGAVTPGGVTDATFSGSPDPSIFGEAHSTSLNNIGQLLFTSPLSDGSSGAWVYENGGSSLLLRTGQLLEVAPGDSRTVNGFSVAGFNDDGYAAFTIYFDDFASSGVFLFDTLEGRSVERPILPEPPSPTGPPRFRFPGVNVGSGGLGITRPIFFDPDFATGYVYEIETGPEGGLFASVLIPSTLPGGDGAFSLTFDDGVLTTVDLFAGVEYFFANPVSMFTITGIDLAEGLDPENATAFITGVTFSVVGEYTFTQTPIIETVSGVPTPAALPAGVMLLGVVLMRRRFSGRR